MGCHPESPEQAWEVGQGELHEVQQDKVQGPAQGSGQRLVPIQIGDEGIESNPAEKDLGVLVYEKLRVTWLCVLTAQKANPVLGCMKRSMASRWREAILPLCSGATTSGILHPAWEPSAQEGHGAVGAGPEEGHKND